MEVRIEGQNVEVASGSDIATALKAALSGKKFKSVVAVRIGEKEYDLSAPVPEGTQEIEPIFAETPQVPRLSAIRLPTLWPLP